MRLLIAVVSMLASLSFADPARAQTRENNVCLQPGMACEVSFTVHPTREAAVRLQAQRLGIRVVSLTVDASRPPQEVSVRGPGGSGSYPLSIQCVTKITTTLQQCGDGESEIPGTACRDQNSELVTAAFQRQAALQGAEVRTAGCDQSAFGCYRPMQVASIPPMNMDLAATDLTVAKINETAVIEGAIIGAVTFGLIATQLNDGGGDGGNPGGNTGGAPDGHGGTPGGAPDGPGGTPF